MPKENAFDKLSVGEELGPLQYTITEEAIARFAEATEDYGDWYMKDSPFGGRIAHPTLTTTDYSLMLFPKVGVFSGLHAKHESEFYNPARLGKRMTVTAKVLEKYEKRGREYFVLEYRTVDEDGQDIVRHRITSSVDRVEE